MASFSSASDPPVAVSADELLAAFMDPDRDPFIISRRLAADVRRVGIPTFAVDALVLFMLLMGIYSG